MTAPRLDLRAVSKTFGGARVLHDVSLDIAPGEVHALVGQNGSGKSTLIKILAGFHRADPGATAFVDGQARELGDPDDIHDAGVEFVHQDLGLVPALSVVDNLALGHGYATGLGGRISWRRQRKAAETAIHAVGYEVDVRKTVDELQPVEKTAVAIARALQSAGGNMSVLILDEPTATMPKAEVQRLHAIVKRVREQGVGILYVSHHLEEVFELADRVTVLVDGHRVATKPCSELDQRSLVNLMTGGVVDEARRRSTADLGEPVLELASVGGLELKGLDLTVHAGEVVGVAGITGSGREELCSLIFGARSREGRVSVRGRALPASNPHTAARLGLALVPANRLRDGVVIGLNVRENLNLTTLRQLFRRGRIPVGDDRRQAAGVSRKMSVKAPSLEAPIEALSGGNQQKVVLGKWLQTDPAVLLLDEPTQGVDVAAKAEIHHLIDDVASRGVAVLVCSSDEAELERLCDRAVVLRHGQIMSEFNGDDIQTRRLVHTSLGLTDEADDEGANGHAL
jgi:ribose transport system ATP-binding protein